MPTPAARHELGPLREHWERSKIRPVALIVGAIAILFTIGAIAVALTPLESMFGPECIQTRQTETHDARGAADDYTKTTSTTVCSPAPVPTVAIWASFALAFFALIPEMVTRLPGVKFAGFGLSAEVPAAGPLDIAEKESKQSYSDFIRG